MNKLLCLAGAAVCLLLAGCTTPVFERTVTKTYDGQGNLEKAVIVEHVVQPGTSRPLIDALSDQTYQNKP